MNQNRYTIIIPSKNYTNMVACLLAIRESGETCDVIFVDDTETPMPADTMRTLAELGQDHLAFVPGRKPFCFGRNINLGIKAIDKRPVAEKIPISHEGQPEEPEAIVPTFQEDDVILMNDDALLVDGTFKDLALAAYLNPQMAVVSAAITGYDNSACPLKAMNARKEMAEDHFVRRLRNGLPFVCAYIRRGVLDAVGMLDERFTGYAPLSPILCPQCGWGSSGMHPDGTPFPITGKPSYENQYAIFRCGQCLFTIQVPVGEVYGGEDNDYCYRATKQGLHVGVYDGCIVNHATLKSSFRPDGLGRSIAGARSRFFQVHGVAMVAL